MEKNLMQQDKETPFNLSEKIVDACSIDSFTVIEAEDVKEFVRKLKSDFQDAEEKIPFDVPSMVVDYAKIIDKLAGDKLQ